MRGISEERLKDLCKMKDLCKKYSFIGFILAECTELNAWQPIETAPLNKPIRLFKKAGYQYEGAIMIESHREFFTHWQELPEDPK